MLRSYDEEKLYLNVTSNITKALVRSHLAILQKRFSYDLGQGLKRDYEYDTVASCITFMPSSRMPIGDKNNVRLYLASLVRLYKMKNYTDKLHF